MYPIKKTRSTKASNFPTVWNWPRNFFLLAPQRFTMDSLCANPIKCWTAIKTWSSPIGGTYKKIPYVQVAKQKIITNRQICLNVLWKFIRKASRKMISLIICERCTIRLEMELFQNRWRVTNQSNELGRRVLLKWQYRIVNRQQEQTKGVQNVILAYDWPSRDSRENPVIRWSGSPWFRPLSTGSTVITTIQFDSMPLLVSKPRLLDRSFHFVAT